MSVAETVIGVAVALSPESHRDVRREQWLADVRDAHELDLSRTRLALGALTTALFHRRAVHRSNWGEFMSAAPIATRAEPHSIRTVPVLVWIAVASVIASGMWILLNRDEGFGSAFTATLWRIAFSVLHDIVPAAALILAMRLVRGVRVPRAAVGGARLAAAALFPVLYPYLGPDTDMPLELIAPVAGLAGWLIAVDASGVLWSALAVPAILDLALRYGNLYNVVAPRVGIFMGLMPELAAIALGAIITVHTLRSSTDALSGGEGDPAPLVDKRA